MHRAALAMILICTAIPVGAKETAAHRGPYVSLATGPTISHRTSVTILGVDDHISTEVGGVVTAAAGWQITEHLRAELSASYRAIKIAKIDLRRVPLGWRIHSLVPLVSGYLDAGEIDGVQPYIGFGVGPALAWLDDTVSADMTSSDVAFAYSATVGLNFRLTDHTMLGLGYRFTGTSGGLFDLAQFGGAIDAYTHDITVGLRVGFY